MDQQEQNGSLEMRTSAVEEGMKMFEERMNAICFDVKILLAHNNIMNEWISSKFGIELINKESAVYKHICSDIEELSNISDRLSLRRQSAAESSQSSMNADTTTTESRGSRSRVNAKNANINIATTAAEYGHEEAAAAAVVEDLDEAEGSQILVETFEGAEGEMHVVENLSSTSNSGKAKPKTASKITKTQHPSSNMGPKSPNFNSRKQSKRITCQICNRSIAGGVKSLEVHMRTHSGERPYSCAFCNKQFNTAGNLEIHMRTHTGEKPYSCVFCHREFSIARNMTRHMSTHTGEKPYTCNICHRGFFDGTSLKVHMRIHSGEKPFSCNICLRKFTTISQLNQHSNVHRGEKPYKCHLCRSKYTTKYNRDNHLRTVHQVVNCCSCRICGLSFETDRELQLHVGQHKENHTSGNELEDTATARPSSSKMKNDG